MKTLSLITLTLCLAVVNSTGSPMLSKEKILGSP